MIPRTFANYMSYCDFKPISIAEFHSNYKQKEKYVTKQVLTKWLNTWGYENGYKINTITDGKKRMYIFEKSSINITERDLSELHLYDKIYFPKIYISEAKSLIKPIKKFEVGIDRNLNHFIIRIKA